MNITVQPIDLFPTRIWSFDLSEMSECFPQWQQTLSDWRSREPTPAGRSNRAGWNSPKTVFADPVFAPLLEASKHAFVHAFREIAPNKELRFALEAWANIHDPLGYNVSHVHQSVLLCACFYLTVPAGAGAIVFRDPRPGVELSPFIGDGKNSFNCVNIVPKPGTLLLFPNWLAHSVESNEASTQRQSIAMNALQA
jgi:uncharacterized protein (TIGR02466 family)